MLQDWSLLGIIIAIATFALSLHKIIRAGIDKEIEALNKRIERLEREKERK